MDCSNFKVFLSERKRMCNSFELCKDGCPLYRLSRTSASCENYCFNSPESAVEIVQKWSDEHQPETRLSKFLKENPNAVLKPSGIPVVCAGFIFGFRKWDMSCDDSCGNFSSCVRCWNKPAREGE